MPNGATARLPFPASAPAFAQPGKPGESIEGLIGAVTAAAAAALGQALVEYSNGGLTRATRAAGGDLVAGLYELQQVALARGAGIDFATVMRREGKRVLRQQHAADLPDAAIDEMIGWLLEIVAKVTAFERARAN